MLSFAVVVTAKATSELGGANVAGHCSELSARRDRLHGEITQWHAEITRRHAEAAIVEAELGALCAPLATNQTVAGFRPLSALPSQSTGAPTDEVASTHQLAIQSVSPKPTHLKAEHPPPVRRTEETHSAHQRAYAVHCWAAMSAFTDPSCNCLGESAPLKLGSRPTIKIVVGNWCVHRSACLRFAHLESRGAIIATGRSGSSALWRRHACSRANFVAICLG